jgi:hypothetical protein
VWRKRLSVYHTSFTQRRSYRTSCQDILVQRQNIEVKLCVAGKFTCNQAVQVSQVHGKHSKPPASSRLHTQSAWNTNDPLCTSEARVPLSHASSNNPTTRPLLPFTPRHTTHTFRLGVAKFEKFFRQLTNSPAQSYSRIVDLTGSSVTRWGNGQQVSPTIQVDR